MKDYINVVEVVAEVSRFVPQSTYAGMQRTLQQEWTFVQRVVPNIDAFFKPLESSIQSKLFSELFGETVDDPLRLWLSLQIKKGGASIPDPEAVSKTNFYASSHECDHLVEAVGKVGEFNVVTHGNQMSEIRKWTKMEKLKGADDWIDEHCKGVDGEAVRIIESLKEDGVGTW